MDQILSLLKEFDIANLLPELESFLVQVELAMRIVVLAGPLTILGLGLWYYLAPPKEANHSAGFRTYFGMGSIAAWRYTQRIAGTGYTVAGFVLTVIMGLVCNGFRGKDAMDMAVTAFVCVIVELVLILGVWTSVQIMVYRKFDKNGKLRK